MMDHLHITFDQQIEVNYVTRGATVVVGDNMVTNGSLNKTNQSGIHVGDGCFMNHTERIITIDKDQADLFILSLNDYIQSMF